MTQSGPALSIHEKPFTAPDKSQAINTSCQFAIQEIASLTFGKVQHAGSEVVFNAHSKRIGEAKVDVSDADLLDECPEPRCATPIRVCLERPSDDYRAPTLCGGTKIHQLSNKVTVRLRTQSRSLRNLLRAA